MPRGGPDRQALTKKMAYDVPSEKSRSSKHRYNSIGYGKRSTSQACAAAGAAGLVCSFEELSARSSAAPVFTNDSAAVDPGDG